MSWNLLNQVAVVFGIFGFPLTLIGLGFTFHQVHQAKSAAELAQRAARNALQEVSNRLFHASLSKTAGVVHEVKQALIASDTTRIADRAQQARLLLAGLVIEVAMLPHKDLLMSGIDDLLIVQENAETAMSNSARVKVTREQIRRIDKLNIDIHMLDSSLKAVVVDPHKETT